MISSANASATTAKASGSSREASCEAVANR
ncbi:Uncharacterised protein [Mycobacterium tuberculosis]|uniref:Uncharacterized protein n=1 Tax=Mycobacterium tuberculosis TaxID=1773 RepID=A0A916LE70_MYCTX|nr:Uncharacterised protein [Mycobacterium tuberculosis]